MKFLFHLWLHIYTYFHLQCKMELYYVIVIIIIIIIIIIKTKIHGLCLRANYTDRGTIIINGSTALLLGLVRFLNFLTLYSR
jgi:hypothetical protein